MLERKILGLMRSLLGGQFLAWGFSVHETCLRQGVDLWDLMHKTVHAFIANTALPGLVPRTGSPVAAPTA